ncbi:hypothetical protein [Mesobacterium pallidum]|uniref:hypothetical protein n=1 Tax=Mesobacterium pallidum TaxID=2872037 RepID=UPI001EE388B5|nr:hypothetical protein [Mesobacterium pallidum]
MTSQRNFSEEDLLAYTHGRADAELRARIEAAAEGDPALRAELAMTSALKGALGDATDGPDTRELGWRRLEAEIKRSAPANVPTTPRTAFWRVAAVVLGALVLGQGAYIATAPGDAPTYRTVSEEAEGFVLAVAFTADAQMAETQALLREIGARVVDGPSAIGLFRLAFDSAEDLAAARAALAASPLIDLVSEE